MSTGIIRASGHSSSYSLGNLHYIKIFQFLGTPSSDVLEYTYYNSEINSVDQEGESVN